MADSEWWPWAPLEPLGSLESLFPRPPVNHPGCRQAGHPVVGGRPWAHRSSLKAMHARPMAGRLPSRKPHGSGGSRQARVVGSTMACKLSIPRENGSPPQSPKGLPLFPTLRFLVMYPKFILANTSGKWRPAIFLKSPRDSIFATSFRDTFPRHVLRDTFFKKYHFRLGDHTAPSQHLSADVGPLKIPEPSRIFLSNFVCRQNGRPVAGCTRCAV